MTKEQSTNSNQKEQTHYLFYVAAFLAVGSIIYHDHLSIQKDICRKLLSAETPKM